MDVTTICWVATNNNGDHFDFETYTQAHQFVKNHQSEEQWRVRPVVGETYRTKKW
jgi:hypothetical protein